MTTLEAERRTSYLELFFDLVFVFAITQVTALVLEDTSAAGFARAVLLLGLVYWAWSGYAWLTNAVDIESTAVRLLFLVGMAGSFFTALALPGAYGDDAALFAVPYFVIRVIHVALYIWGLRSDPEHQRAVRQLAPWFLVAPTFALAAGFVADDRVQTALWVASLAIDLAGAASVGRAGFRVSPSHFAERYGLFMIIALGESIVAIGVGAAGIEHDLTFGVAAVIAFAGVAALWWAYFDFTAHAAESALRTTDELRRGPVARDVFTFFHFPAVLGIILYAVAAEKTLAHPADPLSESGRVALGAGIALYLLSATLVQLRAARRIAWEQAAGAAAALGAALVLDGLAAMWVVAVAVAILVAATAVRPTA